MIRTRELKFVHDPMGDRDELYDLAADPWELCNVAGQESYRSAQREMERRMLAWSIGTEDPAPVPLPEPRLRL